MSSDPSEVFEKYVLGDPEFRAACGLLPVPRGRICQGECYTFYDRIWPIAVLNDLELVLGPEHADEELPKAAVILCDRLIALIELLRRGVVVAQGYSASGQFETLQPGLWDGGDVLVGFRAGDFLRHVSNDWPRVEYRGLMLKLPVTGTLAKPETPEVTFEGKKQVRKGRTPSYDWSEAARELVRIANSLDGLPETQAEAARHLEQWFLDKYGKAPAHSSIKEHVANLWPGRRD